VVNLRGLASDQRLAVPWCLFALGLIIGQSHLPLSLELSVTLSHHGSLTRSLLLFLYPLAVAVLGLGAVLERRLSRDRGRHASPIAGAGLAAFLAAALRVNFLDPAPARLALAAAASLATLSCLFLALGVTIAHLLRRARSAGARPVMIAWVAHLGGLVIGYLSSDPLVYAVGVNAMLACAALALLLPLRLAPVTLVALLALSPWARLDDRLEGWRDLQPFEQRAFQAAGERPALYLDYREGDGWRLVYRAWSRFAQTRLLWHDDKGLLRGYHNFFRQFLHRSHPPRRPVPMEKLRRVLYGAAAPDDRIVVLAAGTGRSLEAFGFAPHRRITLVERDDALVAHLRDERPDLNGRAFADTDAVGCEGRYYVERSAGPFDRIIVETGRFSPAWVRDAVGATDTLYTREALAAYLAKLAPQGVLLVGFVGTGRSPAAEYYPIQVGWSLDELGVPHAVYALDDPRSGDEVFHLYWVASPTAAGLAAFTQRVDAREASRPGSRLQRSWQPRTAGDARHRRRLTDAMPFAHWARAPAEHRRIIWGTAAVLCAALLVVAGALSRRRIEPWRAVPFFFAIGVAQVVTQLGTIYAFRTFFGDAVTTTIRLLVYFTLLGAIGALAAPRLLARRPGRTTLLGLVAVVAAVHFAATHFVPFGATSQLFRELSAIALVAPGALLMGVYFPAGLMAARERSLGRLILADSLGTLFGYGLFHVVLLTLGRDLYLALGLALYLAAAALLGPGLRHAE